VKRKGLLLKKAAIVLAGIVVLAVAGIVIIDRMIRNKVIQQLQQLEPAVHITYSDLHTDIFSSTLSLDNLTVQVHPSSKNTHQHVLYIRHLLITGIHYLKLASAKDLVVKSIQLDSSDIQLDQLLLDNTDSAKAGNSLKMPFERIAARRIVLTQSHISIIDKETERLKLDGNLTLHNAELTGHAAFTGAEGEFTNFSYLVPHAFHTLQIKKITISSRDEILKLQSVAVVPLYEKFELGKKLGRQADHIRASIAVITIDSPDIVHLPDKKLIAKKISISGCKANIFRDRRLPRKLVNQALPVDFLRSLPYDIHVNNCTVSNASVVYEEYPAQGDESGILRIQHLNTTLSPLINHPGKNDPDHLNMYVKGSIMGSGTVEGSIYMPLQKNKNYHVKGIIKNLDLPHLNSSAENLGLYHIESGVLNMLAFDFTMNEKKSEGKIVGEYHNLVIQKLEFNKKGEKNIAHLRSFVMRHVIIPKNKDKSLPEKKRTGKVDFTRDPTRFVSNYLLQSLLTGIKSSFTFGFLIPK
jgi:hypothetical protein